MKNPEFIRGELEEWQQLASEIEHMQEGRNEGMGISCVRTVAAYLKLGDARSAKVVCWNEGDKIRGYPDIRKLLTEKLFAGEIDYPWKITDEFEKKKQNR